jgi:hypothetical protein
MTAIPATRTRNLPIPAWMLPLTQVPRNLPEDEVVPEVGAVLLLPARAAKAVRVVLAIPARTKKTKKTKRSRKTREAKEAALQTQRVRAEPLAAPRQVQAVRPAPSPTMTLAFRTRKGLT